jgi:hypothetical protein
MESVLVGYWVIAIFPMSKIFCIAFSPTILQKYLSSPQYLKLIVNNVV